MFKQPKHKLVTAVTQVSRTTSLDVLT